MRNLPYSILLILGVIVLPDKAFTQPVVHDTSRKITYSVIANANGSYGYDILIDNKLKIHQPSRPAMPGNKGFSRRSSAEKVAKLAVEKIKKGEMPPTITPSELKHLHAK